MVPALLVFQIPPGKGFLCVSLPSLGQKASETSSPNNTRSSECLPTAKWFFALRTHPGALAGKSFYRINFKRLPWPPREKFNGATTAEMNLSGIILKALAGTSGMSPRALTE